MSALKGSGSDSSNWLENVEILLCRPQGAFNIGACCRAMKSMGLNNLTLIMAPEFEADEVKKIFMPGMSMKKPGAVKLWKIP